MDNKNLILAFALSFIILLGWQYFILGPQIEDQRQIDDAQRISEQSLSGGKTDGQGNSLAPQTDSTDLTPSAPSSDINPQASRESRVSATSRIEINTPSLSGSINLTGGRLDDLSLLHYRETTDKSSANVVLFSPSGAPHAFYANFGWSGGKDVGTPSSTTVWKADGRALTPSSPLTLTWDNGEGLLFKRRYLVDENYLFTVEQSVRNSGDKDVTLFPYGLISRHETPIIEGFFILHEGLIGHVEADKVVEVDYDEAVDAGQLSYNPLAGGWLGITDKYWAAALIPDASLNVRPKFFHVAKGPSGNLYQADFIGDGKALAKGAAISNTTRLFAGAKQVSIIDGYAEEFGIAKFDLLIDWGWFYFITKPLFWLLEWFFVHFGNFGLAILAATVVIKLVFFPLANRSYVSMSRMKMVQPQMMEIKERHANDKAAQQKAMMELYKNEKINPLSGCLPIIVQIPVFFALYKVLFVTIEMRHAPFYGWIRDLAAPDPTSLFNLFGLIPWDPPSFLLLGIWPLLMGITMFIQMKLNPAPPDATQRMIFNWMPVVFTFMLASFPAGLVIYWAWNNLLSITQQSIIMVRQGAKVEIIKNIKDTFKPSKK